MVRHFALRIGRLLAIAWILLSACWPVLSAAQGVAAPDGLSTSAEYIAGFVRHVRWQDEAQLPAWRVCVVGALPRDQERAYVGRVVRGKPFVVVYIEVDAALEDCQVLDLTAADIDTAKHLLSDARKMPILAVGSGAAFCAAGGQICLHIGSGAPSTQKFEVNLSTIRESRLDVSARLLGVGAVRATGDAAP